MPLRRTTHTLERRFQRTPNFPEPAEPEPVIPRNILDLHTAHALANSPLDLVICGVWNVRVTVGDLRTLIDELGPSAQERRASKARVTATSQDGEVA